MAERSASAAAAGRALFELGGCARPGDVGRAAGLPGSTQAHALGQLERAGLITRSRSEVALTPAGWDAFIERSRPDAGALDEALSFWPYRHRAFLELLLSTIVARWHLSGTRPDPYLGFMAIGATGSGKSAMAGVVCHLLGLDEVSHTLFLPQETDGSVRGRREQLAGGGWKFTPAPATSLPFVFFDEFDKADQATQRSVLPYFQGKTSVVLEGEPVLFRPTPMLAANPPRSGDRFAQLRGEYRRRCVVLDAGSDRDDVMHLEAALSAFYEEPRWKGCVRLEETTVAAALDSEIRAALLDPVGLALLTDTGREFFCSARALELAALGRSSLLASDDPVAATLATVHDYLACLETAPDLVRADWHVSLEDVRAAYVDRGDVDVHAVTAALGRRRRTEAAAHERAAMRRQHERSEDLELVRQRGALTARLKLAIDDLDGRRVPTRQDKAPAAGIRAQLQKLRADAAHVQSHSRLAELEQLASAPLAAAEQLRTEIEDRRTEEIRQQQMQKAAQREAQRVSAAVSPSTVQRQRQRHLKTSLDDARRTLRPLEGLYRRKQTKSGERPLDRLRRVRLPDGTGFLLEYEPPAQSTRKGGFLQALLSAAGGVQGTWRCTLDPSIAFAGGGQSCNALDAWGANTRRVLFPLIAVLREIEDALVTELGCAPRRGRLSLEMHTWAEAPKPAAFALPRPLQLPTAF